MGVSRPRAYAAYAPAPLAPRSAPAPLRPAPGSGRLRARVAVRLRLLVRFGQGPHHVGSLVVQPLQAPRLAPGERVRGENRKADRVIEVADRSEEHTSELQSRLHLVCRLLLEKKKTSNER